MHIQVQTSNQKMTPTKNLYAAIVLLLSISGLWLFHDALADFFLMMFDNYLSAMETLVDLKYFAC